MTHDTKRVYHRDEICRPDGSDTDGSDTVAAGVSGRTEGVADQGSSCVPQGGSLSEYSASLGTPIEFSGVRRAGVGPPAAGIPRAGFHIPDLRTIIRRRRIE